MPATTAALRTYLGIDPATSVDQAAMDAAVAAANDAVVMWRADLTTDPGDGTVLPTWPPRVDQAAIVQVCQRFDRGAQHRISFFIRQ